MNKMKQDPDFDAAQTPVLNVAGEEIRQFVERFERLEAEKKDLAADQKEVMAEAKGRGYCVATLKRLVSLRKVPEEKRNEAQQLLELYSSAIGM